MNHPDRAYSAIAHTTGNSGREPPDDPDATGPVSVGGFRGRAKQWIIGFQSRKQAGTLVVAQNYGPDFSSPSTTIEFPGSAPGLAGGVTPALRSPGPVENTP